MKINFWFEVKKRLLSKNVEDEVVKVYTNIRVLNSDKTWSYSVPAIIDTGAHTSLLPKYLWENSDYEYISDSLFMGVKSNLLCSLPCKVGKITIALLDTEGNFHPIDIIAYLSKTNDTPPIIGVSTLMNKGKVCIDYKNRKGFLEF
ncbi:MAG TPA: hypothetical protein PKW55_05895 [Spirochaetota bacterium]|nr:hypothetical protein [Spirochaetota bacterium]HOM38416.1 hypothetical protein [Spirochaetota bacterium]HPQ48955.1 hypothetical protein [Spirochaetota bacterium]